MRKEALIKSIQLGGELRKPKIAEVVVFVNFSGPDRGKRQEILGISGNSPVLTVISPDQSPAHIIELPIKRLESTSTDIEVKTPEISPIDEVKKTESYHPRRRQDDYVDKTGRRIIRKRGSGGRCRRRGRHEYGACGSSFCQVKEGIKGQRTESQQPIAIASAKLRSNRRKLQKAA